MQNPASTSRCPPEPVHTPGSPGESGNGMNKVPQALLLAKVLFMTVSLVAPDTVIPVPGGSPANPAPGAATLLLSWEKLFRKTQQEWVPVMPLVPLNGQAPF